MQLRDRILWAAGLGCWVGVVLVACSSGTTGEGDGSGAGGGAGAAVGGAVGSGGVFSGSGGFSRGGMGPIIPNPQAGMDSGPQDASVPATGDANCGASSIKLDKKPADLLLVLDRSSSMTRAMDSSDACAANATDCAQRWATMTSSLDTVLASSSTDVHWGLKFFTSPASSGRTTGRCTVNAGVEVGVAPNNAAAIQTQISQAGTASSTPTRLAVEAAVAYLKTVND